MAITKERTEKLRRKTPFIPKGVEVTAQDVAEMQRALGAVYDGRITSAFAFRIAAMDRAYPAAPATGK